MIDITSPIDLVIQVVHFSSILTIIWLIHNLIIKTDKHTIKGRITMKVCKMV